MEAPIIVAIISLLASIVTAWFVKNSNKHINDASAKKVNAEADDIIFNIKNQVIIELQEQINQLKAEMTILKKNEEIHIHEKIRLEEKLELVIKENKSLKTRITENKESYDLDVKILREQITMLKQNLAEHEQEK